MAEDKIFLITEEKKLEALEARTYDNEDMLQRYLSDYPDLLAGYQMNEADPRRWLLVAREIGIADELAASERWSLDHLFLDQDGTPTLVEVKRASDTRIRREVVGQMLDYAANAILHWSPELVRQRFEDRCKSKNIDPTQAVATLLNIDPSETDQIESFWEMVFNKLQTGQVRLLFVADRIPKELRRIIEFLNEHMPEVDVLGVELPQYVGSNLTTIVPKVIGKTTVAEQAKRKVGSRDWDEDSYFAEMAIRHPQRYVEIARRILDWTAKRNLRIWWGKGQQDPSFIPVLDYAGRSQTLFAVYLSAAVELQFQHYKQPPFDNMANRRVLADRLNQIPGVRIPEEKLTKRPSIKFAQLLSPESLSALLSTYDWFLDQLEIHTIEEGADV